jgi:hypothetical protein
MVLGGRTDFSQWDVRYNIDVYGIPNGKKRRMSQPVED